jgi:hypothetical protein
MRRLVALTSVLVLVVTAAAIASGAPVSARAPARITPVRPRSAWTLLAGAFCERDAFAPGRAFTALDPDNGDGGVYRGKKTVTMTWKAGASEGAVFKGAFTRSAGYAGTFADAFQTVPAYLVPSSTFGCVTVTTAPTTTSVAPGATVTGTATVTGDGGVTPAGTVHFYVCPGEAGPCTPTAASVVDLGTVALTGTGSGPDPAVTATSPAFSTVADGAYCFDGVYSGDTHYPTASDGSTSDECFTVGSVS